jgi:glutathione S-transferase
MKAEAFLFYGMQCSWYSAKLRPYLRYKAFPFVEKLPTSWDWHVTIKNRCGNPTVPVVVTPEGEWLQDTSVIIERMEERFPAAPVVPREPTQRFAAHLIELWADEFWQAAGLYTRWRYKANHPRWEAEVGQVFAPWAPTALKRLIGKVPAAQMPGFVAKFGAVKGQIPLLERWIARQLDLLDAHFLEHPFLFGDRPSLGDFALMGPLSGHMRHDVESSRLWIEPRPHLFAWTERMIGVEPHSGEFLPDDEIPATLAAIISDIFAETTPYLVAGAELVRAKLPKLEPGARLPRMAGVVHFPLSDGRYSRQFTPYTLWMAQQTLDVLGRLTTDDEAKVRAWAASLGGQTFLNLDIPRLRRIGLQAAPELTFSQ